MRRLFVLATSTALALSVMAQQDGQKIVPLTGELLIKGGLGNINPAEAKLQLTIKDKRYEFKPYVGVNIINKSGSGVLGSDKFNYTGTTTRYDSQLETYSKGVSYTYGFTEIHNFTPYSKLTTSFDGSYSAMHGYGSRQEQMMMGELPLSFISDIDKPTNTLSTYKVNVVYQQRLKDEVSSFSVRFNSLREDHDEETDMQAVSGMGLFPYKENYLQIHDITQSFSVQADFQRKFAWNQLLNVGLRYDRRYIESENQQYINTLRTLSELFTHTMNVGAAFAEYKIAQKYFNVGARLEYDFTDMNGKNLHDVIPSLNALWHIRPMHDLQFVYAKRIVRPDVSYLNPAKIYGAFTLDYGNPDLEGIHLNNFSLSHIFKSKAVRLATTLTHLKTEDGFNAIWMVKDGMRVSFWGNEGIRRMWSLTPDLVWTYSPKTIIDAKITVAWDKRIAEAIHMAKEHWGITAHLGLKQQLPYRILLNVHGEYSEGNTIDLYSHAGRSYSYGGELKRSFLKDDKLDLVLSYSNTDYAKTILTQGAYTGEIFTRPLHHYILAAALKWKF